MTITLNGSTGLSGVDGTEGAPAVQGTDSDTGIFYPAVNTVAVSTAGSERLRTDLTGNFYVETGPLWQYAPTPTSKSAAATLTAAELRTGIIVGTGTAYTLTLPTGATIDASFTGAPTTNIGFDFYVVSGASGVITMAINSGVTNSGGLTVAAGTSAHFRLRRTAADTYVMYRLS